MAGVREPNGALLEENSIIIGAGEQEQATVSSSVVINSEGNEKIDTLRFAAELNKALESVTENSNLAAAAPQDQSARPDPKETSPSAGIMLNDHSDLPGSDSKVPQERGHFQYVAPLEDPYDKAWEVPF